MPGVPRGVCVHTQRKPGVPGVSGWLRAALRRGDVVLAMRSGLHIVCAGHAVMLTLPPWLRRSVRGHVLVCSVPPGRPRDFQQDLLRALPERHIFERGCSGMHPLHAELEEQRQKQRVAVPVPAGVFQPGQRDQVVPRVSQWVLLGILRRFRVLVLWEGPLFRERELVVLGLPAREFPATRRGARLRAVSSRDQRSVRWVYFL